MTLFSSFSSHNNEVKLEVHPIKIFLPPDSLILVGFFWWYFPSPVVHLHWSQIHNMSLQSLQMHNDSHKQYHPPICLGKIPPSQVRIYLRCAQAPVPHNGWNPKKIKNHHLVDCCWTSICCVLVTAKQFIDPAENEMTGKERGTNVGVDLFSWSPTPRQPDELIPQAYNSPFSALLVFCLPNYLLMQKKSNSLQWSLILTR